MSDLERFLHDRSVGSSVLVKAGLAHAQFETIHPFLDGNGRVGRLLITLLLIAEDVLTRPLLYLSLYFKEDRDATTTTSRGSARTGSGRRGSSSSWRG